MDSQLLLDAGGFSSAIIPWHTSASSCEQWLHTWPCRSCTCEQFQGQVDHQDWDPSKGSIWTAAPKYRKYERLNEKIFLLMTENSQV